MLTMDQIHHIRALYYEQGYNISEIAAATREFDTYGIMPIPSNKAIATPTGEFFCQILRIY